MSIIRYRSTLLRHPLQAQKGHSLHSSWKDNKKLKPKTWGVFATLFLSHLGFVVRSRSHEPLGRMTTMMMLETTGPWEMGEWKWFSTEWKERTLCWMVSTWTHGVAWKCCCDSWFWINIFNKIFNILEYPFRRSSQNFTVAKISFPYYVKRSLEKIIQSSSKSYTHFRLLINHDWVYPLCRG